MPVRLRPFHGEEHRSAPLAADANALDETQRGEENGAPDANLLIRRHERDQESRDAHQQQRRNQRSFAAKPISIVAKNRGANWSSQKTDGVNCERFQRADERVGSREIQPGKDKTGDGAVEEEVVPLDGGADRARDNGAPQLSAVFLRRDATGADRLAARSHTCQCNSRSRCRKARHSGARIAEKNAAAASTLRWRTPRPARATSCPGPAGCRILDRKSTR